jgi:hypothetical protein
MNPFRNDLSRRAFVSGAAKTFLGVSAASRVIAAPGVGTSPLKQAATARNVIYLYMTGGMSHLDTWDPKPDNKDVMGLTKVINTNVDGIRLSENLPLMARQADKLAIIRGMNSTQGAHEQGSTTSTPATRSAAASSTPAWARGCRNFRTGQSHAARQRHDRQ